MTDNEIIKALECLKGYAVKCRDCSYSVRFAYPNCQKKAAKDALDLINRQKAEIERLKGNNNAIMQTMADVHTEAVKEFAEIIVSDYPEMEYYLDGLRKEMIGETK